MNWVSDLSVYSAYLRFTVRKQSFLNSIVYGGTAFDELDTSAIRAIAKYVTRGYTFFHSSIDISPSGHRCGSNLGCPHTTRSIIDILGHHLLHQEGVHSLSDVTAESCRGGRVVQWRLGGDACAPDMVYFAPYCVLIPDAHRLWAAGSVSAGRQQQADDEGGSESDPGPIQ